MHASAEGFGSLAKSRTRGHKPAPMPMERDRGWPRCSGQARPRGRAQFKSSMTPCASKPAATSSPDTYGRAD
eukprot:2191809-Pyramimonas_sp.AAC.1